jgi:hypothetical protein
VRYEWSGKRYSSRTLALNISTTRESAQPVSLSRLLKTEPAPTGLELAESYQKIAKKHGIQTNKALAIHLQKPLRVIASVMKLLNLCPEAKRFVRTASKDQRLRRKLSFWMLERIHVRWPAQRQIRAIQQLLRDVQ